MDPELYEKIQEHNEEALRLRDKLSVVGLVVSPFLLLIGINLFVPPTYPGSGWSALGSGGYIQTKLSTMLIVMGLYFPYLSIKWRMKSRR